MCSHKNVSEYQQDEPDVVDQSHSSVLIDCVVSEIS